MNTNDNLIQKALARLQKSAKLAWKFAKNMILPSVVATCMIVALVACTTKPQDTNTDTDTNANQTDSSLTDTSGTANDSSISSDTATDSAIDVSASEN